MAPSMVPVSCNLGGNCAPMWRASSRMGATGKRFQLSADRPVRLREIIGGAEMHGERQGRIAGGSDECNSSC